MLEFGIALTLAGVFWFAAIAEARAIRSARQQHERSIRELEL